jgi:hypothetical protein
VVTVSGIGVMDLARRRGRLVMKTAVPDRLAGGSAMEPEILAEQILDGSAVYIRMPSTAGLLPGGRSWLRQELGSAGGAPVLDAGQLVQAGADPVAPLAWLESSERAERVAREKVRGVETTRYRAKVVIAESMPPFTIDVWVSEDDLVRRVSYGWRQRDAGAPPTTVALTIELFDYGAELKVPEPPRADSLDLADLSAQGSGRRLEDGE